MRRTIIFAASLIFNLTCISVLGEFHEHVEAAPPTFDLQDFIAQPYFPTHTLSTGEVVSFTSEGGPGPEAPVRQYKNANYEQLYVGASGIFRREDTSWAPDGQDAICNNGNKAFYTLDKSDPCIPYTNGDSVANNPAFWAPATGSSVGQSWNQSPHQVVTIDSAALPALKYCTLSIPPGIYTSPLTCGTAPSALITAYYEPNTYTFCSGVRNPAPVVSIKGNSEEFLYMEGCGLAGYEGTFMSSGIIEGCGVGAPVTSSTCYVNNADPTDVPILFTGNVRNMKATIESDTGAKVSNAPIRGAAVCTYQGTWDTDVGNRYGFVDQIACTTTDGDGNYAVQGVRKAGGHSFDNANYIGVWVGNSFVDGWKMDLSHEYVSKDFKVWSNLTNVDAPPRPPSALDLGGLGKGATLQQIDDPASTTYKAPTLGHSEIAPGITKPIILAVENFDESYVNDRVYDECSGVPGEGLPAAEVIPSNRGFPGRGDITDVMGSMQETFKLAGSYAQGQIDPLMGDETIEDKLDSCEYIKRCNGTLVDEDSSDGRNTKTCYSLAATMMSPGGWQQLYDRALNFTTPVCKDENGNPVMLSDIEPPVSIKNAPGGPYKYGREDGDYFPYLFLLGDPIIGAETDNLQEAVRDSFIPKYDDPELVTRDERLRPAVEESQKSFSRTQAPAGRSEFSTEAIGMLVNDDVSNDIGENKPLAALLSDPYVPFGYSATEGMNPGLETAYNNVSTSLADAQKSIGTPSATGTNVANAAEPVSGDYDGLGVVRVGRSDYQFWRSYTYNTINNYDSAGEAPFQDFIATSGNDEQGKGHPWVSGFKYLPDQGFWGNLLDAIFGFLFGETINQDVYEPVGVPTNVAFPPGSPTCDKFPDGIQDEDDLPAGECIRWESISSCDAADATCKATSCTIIKTGLPCDQDYDVMCATFPSDVVACTYEVPYYTCAGDLQVQYAATSYAPQDAAYDRAQLGVWEVSRAFASPYETERVAGTGYTVNMGITDEKDTEYASQGANKGGVGATQEKVGSILQAGADPLAGLSHSQKDAPEFVGEIPVGGGDDPGAPNDFSVCDGAPDPGGGHNVKPPAELFAQFELGLPPEAEANINRCYNHIINSAMATNPPNDPVAIMTMWLEESGASTADAHDFGCVLVPRNNFKAQLSCALGIQAGVTNPQDFRFVACAPVQGPNPPAVPAEELNVNEYLQLFACGPGIRGVGGQPGTICYADPPELDFGCTGKDFPEWFVKNYRSVHKDNRAPILNKKLPSGDWSWPGP